MYNLVNDANRPNRISFYVFNPEGRLGVGSYFEDPNDPVVAGQWMHFTGVAANGAITIYKNAFGQKIKTVENTVSSPFPA